MKKSIITFLSLGLILFMAAGCSSSRNAQTIVPEKGTVVVNTEYKGFHGVAVNGSFKVVLADVDKVSIETAPNLQQYVQMAMVDGVLVINLPKNVKLKGNTRITVYVPSKGISLIRGTGASLIIIDGALRGERLDINLSASSRLNGRSEVKYVTANMDTGAQMDITGYAKDFTLFSMGGARTDAFELRADYVTVSLSAITTAWVTYVYDITVTKSPQSTLRVRQQ